MVLEHVKEEPQSKGRTSRVVIWATGCGCIFPSLPSSSSSETFLWFTLFPDTCHSPGLRPLFFHLYLFPSFLIGGSIIRWWKEPRRQLILMTSTPQDFWNCTRIKEFHSNNSRVQPQPNAVGTSIEQKKLEKKIWLLGIFCTVSNC